MRAWKPILDINRRIESSKEIEALLRAMDGTPL